MELIPAKELPQNVLGYYRTDAKEKLAVLINFSKQEKQFQLKEEPTRKLLSTEPNISEQPDKSIILKPFSGILVLMK